MKHSGDWWGWRTAHGYRWYIFLILSVVYFLACLHRIAPTVIARDLTRDFSANATQLGFMASAYFYLYAAVQPPVGLLSDTWGPRTVTSVFTATACAGAILFGLAPNIIIATIGRALIGIGVGGIFVPSLKVFSKWFRPEAFASMTGIFLATGNAGNLAASLPLTYLVIWIGWRMAFVAIGAISLFMALICWLVIRNEPGDKGWSTVAVDPPPPATSSDAPPEGMRALKRMGIVFRQPSFYMVTGAYFFFGGPTLGFQGLWAVPYLTDVHAFSRIQAGWLLMLMPVGFIMGSPIFGILADRLPVGRKPVLTASLIFVMACWTVFVVAHGRPPSVLIGPLFFILGFCGGGALSLFMTMNKELFPIWLTGTAMGLMNPAAFLSTALFQPFSGYLMDAVGRVGEAYPLDAYYRVFVAILIASCLAFIVILPVGTKSKSG